MAFSSCAPAEQSTQQRFEQRVDVNIGGLVCGAIRQWWINYKNWMATV
jgi:hypothetical protein